MLRGQMDTRLNVRRERRTAPSNVTFIPYRLKSTRPYTIGTQRKTRPASTMYYTVLQIRKMPRTYPPLSPYSYPTLLCSWVSLS